nr:nitronate monooxygenase [Phaeovibrio sulfidiphilus]
MTTMDAATQAQARERLDALWARGCEFLGCEVAILGGAMSWISERNLVNAISQAGGFGVIAAGSMPAEILRTEIRETRALMEASGGLKPFGINLITMHPDLDDLISVCLEENISHVVLAGGLPTGESIRRLKSGGIRVLCFAPALALAKKLIRTGADALIIEGTEAGGHIGPVATSILAQEILPEIRDVPVFIAGGIGRGEAIVSYLEMGASGVQLGTRFVCATECIAHPNFKQAFIRGRARDAMPTLQIDERFPVIPVRALPNEGTRLFMEKQRDVVARFERGEIDQKAGQMEIEHFWAGALKRAAIDGDVENGSIMAGQSVGLITCEQPAREIIAELCEQAVHSLAARPGVGA